jgi:glycosyltransferase involved in cell wall biosynthesis
VLFTAYTSGGTTRTVFNQANVLSTGHDVEIASVFRNRETPRFAIGPCVRLVPLTDLRSDGTRLNRPGKPRSWWLRRVVRLPNPLPHRHDRAFRRWRPVIDLKLLRYFHHRDDGVLLTTRPGLNLLSAYLAPPRLVRVAQDHRNLMSYEPSLRKAIARAYRRLDAVVALTEQDRAAYARALDGASTRVVCIPNGVPPSPTKRASLDAKVVIAAGRLEHSKGFDLLLDAFHMVVAKHPEWRLWIFGAGPLRGDLSTQISRLGLDGRAHLKGTTEHLDELYLAASVFALSSRCEGLPMVMLEAMAAGVPVVAFDCPTGPAEVITHRRSGLLVAAQDVPALAASLCELIEDPVKRKAMGVAALAESERFSIATVCRRWEELLVELTARRRTSSP